MLTVERLSVSYGESRILNEVDLRIAPGQVVCLLGRNGVGKTTCNPCHLWINAWTFEQHEIFDRIARREYTLRTLPAIFHHVGQRRPAGAPAPWEDSCCSHPASKRS